MIYILPARWASYLVNGDASSFSLWDDGEAELAFIDEKLAELEALGHRFTGEVSEDSFLQRPEISLEGLLEDCLEYVFTEI